MAVRGSNSSNEARALYRTTHKRTNLVCGLGFEIQFEINGMIKADPRTSKVGGPIVLFSPPPSPSYTFESSRLVFTNGFKRPDIELF